MAISPVESLTDKERQALRLVLSCGTIDEMAAELGISGSAVKQRLASATRKLGVDGRRHKAARLLAEHEGWTYPIRTGPDGQVENADKDRVIELAKTPDREQPSTDLHGETIANLLTNWVIRLGGWGDRNRLSAWQRMGVIFSLMLLVLLLFSMVIATLTETGRFGRSLLAPLPTHF